MYTLVNVNGIYNTLTCCLLPFTRPGICSTGSLFNLTSVIAKHLRMQRMWTKGIHTRQLGSILRRSERFRMITVMWPSQKRWRQGHGNIFRLKLWNGSRNKVLNMKHDRSSSVYFNDQPASQPWMHRHRLGGTLTGWAWEASIPNYISKVMMMMVECGGCVRKYISLSAKVFQLNSIGC